MCPGRLLEIDDVPQVGITLNGTAVTQQDLPPKAKTFWPRVRRACNYAVRDWYGILAKRLIAVVALTTLHSFSGTDAISRV